MSGDFVFTFPDQSLDVLSAILDQSQDCIKLLNINGDLEFMSRNGQVAMGIEDFSAIASQPWVDLWPEDSRKQIDSALEKARRGQKSRFEGYCPATNGDPRWWDVGIAPVRNDEGEISHIIATSRDVTMAMQQRLDDRMKREAAERDAERSDDVAREMRHRLKNQLAVVGSVAKLLARNATDANDMIQRLEEKLQALARAQDLLTIDRDGPVRADEAVRQVLNASGAGDRIEVLNVPSVGLGEESIQLLALILGELQTNSLKYGSLAKAAGKITLSGHRSGDMLNLHWHEDTGAPVSPPAHKGSGTMLIERIGSAGGSRATIDWHETGPSVQFTMRCLQ